MINVVDLGREKLCSLKNSHGKFVDYDGIDVANISQKFVYYLNRRKL